MVLRQRDFCSRHTHLSRFSLNKLVQRVGDNSFPDPVISGLVFRGLSVVAHTDNPLLYIGDS